MFSFTQKASLRNLTRDINKFGLSGGNADPNDGDHSRIVGALYNLNSPAGLASIIYDIPAC